MAAELARRAPGLRVEITREGAVPALEVRSPLIPDGVARVHAAYRPDGYAMMATEPLPGHATGATAWLRSPDPAAIADAIAGWATRPLRTPLPRPAGAAERRRQVQARLRSALADAAGPPPLRSGAGPPGADPALIAFHFPRDRRNRMRASARVLLEVLEPGRPGRRSRCLFVRLREGAFEAFESDEFVENQDHRWNRQPWRWRPGPAVAAAERWGVSDLPAAVAAAAQLEAGEHAAAFARFGVHLGDQLRKVLAGEPLGPLTGDLAGTWGTVAADQLAAAAPWRLPALAGKAWLRVFGLGGSNAQVKPVVALGLPAGAPTLEVMGLGSNRRLAREDWERSLDFEAHRLGLPPPLPARYPAPP